MNCHTSALTLLMFVLAAATASAENINTSTSPATQVFCPKPQLLVDLKQITGKWYVVEIIRHKIDPMRPTMREDVREDCPTVEVRSTGPQSLGLLWTEKAGTLDYFLSIPDVQGAPGSWISRELQNGTMVSAKYVHFNGKLLVMKAVRTHMVLTFCYESPDDQLYSIILARERHLPTSDVQGVLFLLKKSGPTIVSEGKFCVGAGNSDLAPRMMVLIAALATVTLTATQTGFGI